MPTGYRFLKYFISTSSAILPHPFEMDQIGPRDRIIYYINSMLLGKYNLI